METKEAMIESFTERRVALSEVARQYQRLVVLGDPGSGKSTLLRFLALTFAQGGQWVQERLSINEDRLPILVPLSAFAEERKSQPNLLLAEFLPKNFTGQGLPDFSELFDDALRHGHALLLLDGVDEMLWREVVLLTADCLHGDHATAFVENILNAHSPFDDFHQRVSALMQDTLKKQRRLKLCWAS